MNDKKKILSLMCEWNFAPNEWAGIGFRDESVQNKVAVKGSIVAIYIAKRTKSTKAQKKRGKVVGFVELSGETSHVSKFASPRIFANHKKKNKDIDKNRWPYGVEVSRAWYVEKASWRIVDSVFPKTYKDNEPIHIGRRTVPVKKEDLAHFEELRIKPAKVYPQKQLPEEHKEPEIKTVGELLKKCGIPIE